MSIRDEMHPARILVIDGCREISVDPVEESHIWSTAIKFAKNGGGTVEKVLRKSSRRKDQHLLAACAFAGIRDYSEPAKAQAAI